MRFSFFSLYGRWGPLATCKRCAAAPLRISTIGELVLEICIVRFLFLNPPLPSLSLQIAPVWKQIPMYSPQEKITTSSLTKPRPPTPQPKSMKGRFAKNKRTILFGPTDPEFSRPSAGVRVITRNPRVTGPYVCFFVVSVCVCVCVCARAFFVHKMAAGVL